MADISQITIPVKNPSTGVVTNQTYNLKSENIPLIAECSTARSTAAKTVSLTGFTLLTGSHIFVKFTDTEASDPSSGNLTLNVNSTGDKEIVDGHTNYTSLTYSDAGYFCNNNVCEFLYDGTCWIWINRDKDTVYDGSNLKTGVSKTGSGTSVTSTIAANTAMDNAIGTLLNNDAALQEKLGDKACRVYVLSYTKSDMTESTWGGLYVVENNSKTIDTSMFDTIDGQLVTVRFGYGGFQAVNCGVYTSLSPSSSHAVHLELYRASNFPTASYTITMTIVLYGTLSE